MVIYEIYRNILMLLYIIYNNIVTLVHPEPKSTSASGGYITPTGGNT